MLYKAIIDSSFQKKKKEEFQVTANRLPIIDRFHITKRMNKFRENTLEERDKQKYITLEPLEYRSTKMTTLYRTSKTKLK